MTWTSIPGLLSLAKLGPPAVLADLPFLPAGRGALILIFGGLLVLPLSLMMSRVGSRPIPGPWTHAAHASRTSSSASAPTLATLEPPSPAPRGLATFTEVPTATTWLPADPASSPSAVPSSSAAQATWQSVQAPTSASATAAAYPVPTRAAIGWNGSALEQAIRGAVGATQLVWAAPGHYVLRLGRCSSCQRRLAGCELERAAIERVLGPFLRRPRVIERGCAQRERRGRGQCTFEITGA